MNDDSILVVAANGGSALPLNTKLPPWATERGPILLWAGLMALLSLVYAGNLEGEDDSTIIPTSFCTRIYSLTVILAESKTVRVGFRRAIFCRSQPRCKLI